MHRLLCCALLLLLGCAGARQDGIEELSTHEHLSLFKLGSLRGTRDGDRLAARAMFTDSSSILTIDMQFAIGSPTFLQSGAWRWIRNNALETGSVSALSVTFLGGQDGPPSIGGTFELLSAGAGAQYRVTIPVTQLTGRLPK